MVSKQEVAAPEVVIDITPSQGWGLRIKELFSYKDLLIFLAQRDLAVRYKQTVLGAAWAIIQPFTAMVIFSIVFGVFAKIPSNGVPYPVFTYTALLPWQYFASALGNSAQSLIGDERLISKVYFPRLIIPLASLVPPAVDFAISFVILIGMMLFYQIIPTWKLVMLPLFLLLAVTTALGTGLWLSALNVQYRDFRYIIPFLLQIWMYASPVVYPVSIVPDQWVALYSLNPMVAVIEGVRWAVLGTSTAPGAEIGVSIAIAFLLLITGTMYFRRMEATFADVI